MNYPGLPEVVLIEDSMEDEFLSLRGINNSGIECNVTVQRDGADALALILADSSPAPSLIVLDFNLPKLSGLEILREVRSNEKTQFIPVVILSGEQVGRELIDCYRIGANSCVVKPFDAREYVEHVALIVCYWLTVNCAAHRAGPHKQRPSVGTESYAASLPFPSRTRRVKSPDRWASTS